MAPHIPIRHIVQLTKQTVTKSRDRGADSVERISLHIISAYKLHMVVTDNLAATLALLDQF